MAMSATASAAARTAGRRARGGAPRWSRAMSGFANAEEGEQKYIMPTYAKGGVRSKKGLVIERGEGSVVYDTEGNKYIDFGAGIAVTVLGHCDPDVQKAVSEQMTKVAHTSNLYHTNPSLELAEKLISNSPGMSKVFFCNSGTEAAEAALKFSRVYQNAHGGAATRNRFIAMKKSFHGRSLGALSMTYKPAIREPFKPMLMPNVDHIDFNSIEQLEATIGPDVVAVMFEPVQGEGGIAPATREFVKRARELCDEHGVMLIFDEVQIGLGRQGNGRLWSYEEYGVVPDVVTMAKPLANGLPIGAVMLSDKMYKEVPETAWLGSHGSTFASNPVCTKAASVVVDKLLAPGFREQVADSGRHLIERLKAIEAKAGKRIVEVRRPLGDAALYAGIELPGPYVSSVISHCLDRGVIVLSAGDDGKVIRLCPPLTVSKEEIDQAMQVLEEAIMEHVPEATGSAAAGTGSGAARKLSLAMSSASLAADTPEAFEAKLVAEGHTKLPEGFRCGTAGLQFFPFELPRTPESKPASMTMTVIAPDTPTSSYAAMFTQNAFPGAPIKVGREIVASKKPVAAIVVNNKISNVHPKGSGVQDARTVATKVGELLGVTGDAAAVLPSSTGVIGWQLPVDNMVEALPRAVEALQSESVLPAAKGIMTTDTFAKARSCVVRDSDGKELGRFTGIAKGAGMIEPNMATMLVYIMTDIDANPELLKKTLAKAVNSEGSFNRISVDSDQSTSDSIMLLSSQKKPKLPADEEEAIFTEALSRICSELAQDVVRNGEGTQHVMRVHVHGAPTGQLAHGIGKAVVNSPLVKTAIAGNDANVGRIIAAVGSYVGKHNPAWAPIVASKCQIDFGDQTVFKDGEFTIDDKKEVVLQQYMIDAELPVGSHCPKHYKTVDINIYLQGAGRTGGHSSMVFGSDLTHTYVDVNAGYRS